MVARAGSMVTILDAGAPMVQALSRNAQSWSGGYTMSYAIGGRWRDGAMTVIDQPGAFMDFHYGISDDGSVVSGDLYLDDAVAFRWENGVLTQLLGEGDVWSYSGLCSNLSADGDIVVVTAGYQGNPRPAYWQGGVRTFLALPDGTTGGFASSISADGRAIVGGTSGEGIFNPTIWHDGVVSVLPNLAGGSDFASPNVVNDDGTVVAGTATSATGNHLVRWVNGQLEQLSHYDIGGTAPSTFDISSDGSIILGSFGYRNEFRGMIWREGLGLRTFQAYAQNHYGLSLTAALGNYSYFYEPFQMTSDGRYFTGTFYDENYNGRQYMVYLDPADYVVPEPSSVCLVGCAVVGLLWAGRRSQMGLN
jgi:uncharacterized membrane protein